MLVNVFSAIFNFMLIFCRSLLTKWLEDFIILVGFGVVVTTTYMKFGIYVGNFTLGAILILIGVSVGFITSKK